MRAVTALDDAGQRLGIFRGRLGLGWPGFRRGVGGRACAARGRGTRLRKGEVVSAMAGNSLEEALFNFERDLILTRLEQNHYSLAKTADQLKITRHALRYRMQRLNISIDADPDEDTVVPTRKDFSG